MASTSRSNDGNHLEAAKTVSEGVRETIRGAAQSVGDAGAAARIKAQEGLQGLQETASEYLDQGREKALRLEKTLEDQIRSQPVKALLIAAAAGALLGVLLIGRRS